MSRPTKSRHARASAGSASGSVRIIGGDLRGRRLEVATVPGLRPTPNRVRETVFNWLQPDIPGARCLDLFAGTGAMGFEAASRGAAAVILVDSDPRVVPLLQANAHSLAPGVASVVSADALACLATLQDAFDVVFLDPPFSSGLLQEALAALSDYAVVGPGSLVYCEAKSGCMPSLPPTWDIHRKQRAGKVDYCLLRA